MRALVTGGTGFIGRALVARLVDRGYDVRVLSRRAVPPEGWPGRVELIPWTGAGDPMLAEAMSGVEAVINLAGESLGSGRWTRRRKEAILNSRVDTTRALVRHITEASVRPKVMISGSAVGYYGPHSEEELAEAASPGDDFLSEVCSRWEEEAKGVVRQGVRLALLRIGLVLARDGGALARMMVPFRYGLGGSLGSGRQYVSWIHRDDLIGLILHVLQSERFSGPINATAPAPVTNHELARTLGRLMKRPAIMPAPGWMLHLVLGEMADMVLTGQKVVPRRALEFGYVFRYAELESALKAALE